ncbi:MAG: arginine--tRNA ligase [Actinomycetota bacterium]
MITDHLVELVAEALRSAASDGLVSSGELPEISFERPRRREHGDWATNVALSAARGHGNPRTVAEAIVERLPDSDLVERVEVAGPGFLNFHLSHGWLADVVRRAADPGSRFGRLPAERKEKVNVEYVSANPTGPVNVVSGRHAAVGDAVSNLLEAVGREVTREYLINDAGRQINLFAASVIARYLNEFGIDAQVPEDGYHGEYLVDVAKQIAAEHGDAFVSMSEPGRTDKVRDIALALMIEEIRSSLERFGTRFDVWFSEQDRVHSSGAVTKVLDQLRDRNAIEERAGALWFLSTRHGDDKDRVIVRSDGDSTYLAADAAYVSDKFARGFDRLIYLWGADHHGTVTRVLGVAEALGFDRSAVEIRLIQIVTLKRGEEAVKSSKRAGNLVPLDELVDEVGADAARYTFLTRSIDAPLEFDIDLAKEQAPENPVYYVQYAHARISSILRNADDQRVSTDARSAPLERLTHMSETELMRKLAAYEEVLPEAAVLRAPQRVARYVEELASLFSAFYRDCRVIGDDAELTSARLALCIAAKVVIADALALLGVSAPERM